MSKFSQISFICLVLSLLIGSFDGVVGKRKDTASSDFGSVTSSGNTNTNLKGSGNQGNVKDNTNTNIKVSKSTLNVVGNVNTKMEGESNNLTSSHGTNIKFNGDNNLLESAQDTNLNVDGNMNKCKFESNTNVKVKGEGNEGTFTRNTNLRLSGDNGKIVAKDNTNLGLDGNGNNVTVEGTTNHILKNVGNSKGAWNVMTLTFPTTGNSYTVLIDYINKTIISYENYKVGIFGFKMGQKETCVLAHFAPSDYDEKTLVVTEEDVTKFVVRGSKDGTKEILEIHAPKIVQDAVSNGVITLKISKTDSKC